MRFPASETQPMKRSILAARLTSLWDILVREDDAKSVLCRVMVKRGYCGLEVVAERRRIWTTGYGNW
jgi:hypothetical protein